MAGGAQQGRTPGGRADGTARPLPLAALAGAAILIGIAGFALYRRHAAPGSGAQPPASAPSAGAEGSPAEAEPAGGTIRATLPMRLTPEASILAERYRCVCGCNDVLSVCTCQNHPGSEDMKRFLQAQADEKKTPEAIDRAMVERFGPACLLRNPAPPQTLPSHAGGPAPAGGARGGKPSG